MTDLFYLFHGTAALMGIAMLAIGAVRISNARAERRAASPTNHIRYSEGVWRIVVGLGCIGTAATAAFV